MFMIYSVQFFKKTLLTCSVDHPINVELNCQEINSNRHANHMGTAYGLEQKTTDKFDGLIGCYIYTKRNGWLKSTT